MWKIKWRLYGHIAWAYCRKAEKLINNSNGMDPDEYGRRLQYLVNKMIYWMDRRMKLCL